MKAALARKTVAGSQTPFAPRLIHANSWRRKQKKPDKVYANFKVITNGTGGLTSVGEASENLASTLVTHSVNITKTSFGGILQGKLNETLFPPKDRTIESGLGHVDKLEKISNTEARSKPMAKQEE